jgi:hypothetical protein
LLLPEPLLDGLLGEVVLLLPEDGLLLDGLLLDGLLLDGLLLLPDDDGLLLDGLLLLEPEVPPPELLLPPDFIAASHS